MDILCRFLWGHSMIPIGPQTEPADFDHKVRQPGRGFLQTQPNPTAKDWRGHDYWRRAHQDLRAAYKGICAYSSSYTAAPGPSNGDTTSVDHFVPKSSAHNKAYEWDNFRLCRSRLNNRKGEHTDVLDPFILPPAWFELDFLTFLIVPNPSLAKKDCDLVRATIDRLQLNTDNDYVNERIGVITRYCSGGATFQQVGNLYPFIASEMLRQDFDNKYFSILHRRLST